MGDRQRLLNLEDVRGGLGDMFEEITVSGYEWLDVWDQFWTLQGFCQEELHKRLIGQDDAVRVLAQASLECVETSEAADFEILLWTVRRFQLISVHTPLRIQRSRYGLADPNRPIASCLFLGPTGVGNLTESWSHGHEPW